MAEPFGVFLSLPTVYQNLKRKKVSVWAQDPSAILVSWSIQESRSCTWPDIDD